MFNLSSASQKNLLCVKLCVFHFIAWIYRYRADASIRKTPMHVIHDFIARSAIFQISYVPTRNENLLYGISYQSKFPTEWCILSRTTAFPHMMRQGDAPIYYLCVILLIWNILTRTTEVMECEPTMGKCGDVMWMASRIVKNDHSIIC